MRHSVKNTLQCYVAINPLHHGVRGEGEKRGFRHWKLGLRTKISRKSELSSLTPINWFNSCNDSLFAGMTLTLYKSQVHCSGVVQWWACSSLLSAPLPAEAGWETCELVFILMVLIA